MTLKSTNSSLTGVMAPLDYVQTPPLNTPAPAAAHVIKSLSFYNGTFHDITVIDRQGCAFICGKDPIRSNRKFTVRVTYRVSYHYIGSFIEGLKAAAEKGNDEVESIIHIAETTRNHRVGDCRVEVEYSLNENRLVNCPTQGFYFEPLDIVVSLTCPDEAPKHPYSKTKNFGSFGFQDKSADADDRSAFIKIEIIDNEDQYGVRYVNVGVATLKIVPKKDQTRGSGVYYYHPSENITARTGSYIHRTIYGFDEADEKLKLFRHREDAVWAFRDLSETQKRELTQLQLDSQKLKHTQTVREMELESVRREKDQELRDHEQKLNAEFSRIKHSMELEAAREKQRVEQMKMENDRLRSQLDHKAYAYRSVSDNFKVLITVIGSVVALGTIVWKTLSSVQASK